MADIKVYGTLVNETEENKIAYANQVYHIGRENDVATLIDDLYSRTSNLPEPSEQSFKGQINIEDLLGIADDEKNPGDLYLVYSEGNSEEGWSSGSTFEIGDRIYDDGTFILWTGDSWVSVDGDEVETKKAVIFDPLQNKIALIETVYPQTSYNSLVSEEKYGLPIAKIGCYELEEDTDVYRPINVKVGDSQTFINRTVIIMEECLPQIIINYLKSFLDYFS